MAERAFIEALTAELATHGVTRYEVDTSHPHPRLVFEWDGKSRFFVMPSTSSDCYGLQNAITDLRLQLGVKRIIVKSTRRRPAYKPKPKPQIVSLADLSDISGYVDPFLKLTAVKEAIERQEHDAVRGGFQAFLAGLGDGAPTTYSDHLATKFSRGWWIGHRHQYGKLPSQSQASPRSTPHDVVPAFSRH